MPRNVDDLQVFVCSECLLESTNLDQHATVKVREDGFSLALVATAAATLQSGHLKRGFCYAVGDVPQEGEGHK